ncbi:hypothetical protein WJX74_002835 [Apatococcus lobatus]|uniref:Uncharacterized protein n=1 Tax=Apatococcus lobatus TaxID=904363 RepID=A0AAW1RVD2_9CHLO
MVTELVQLLSLYPGCNTILPAELSINWLTSRVEGFLSTLQANFDTLAGAARLQRITQQPRFEPRSGCNGHKKDASVAKQQRGTGLDCKSGAAAGQFDNAQVATLPRAFLPLERRFLIRGSREWPPQHTAVASFPGTIMPMGTQYYG